MRSKIWSKIILFVCFCIIPKYSVVCINFEGDDDPVGIGSTRTEDSSFGSFGDLMPPNFADYFPSKRKGKSDYSDDSDDSDARYNKGKVEDDDDFRSHIGEVYVSNPAKNMFDVLKFDSDIDGTQDNDHVKNQSHQEASPSWEKSIGGIVEKVASIKDSISRLFGIGHKSSTASPNIADGKSDISKKDKDDDEEDDDDDSENGRSNATTTTTTKKDDKSSGNIFTKLFSRSKITNSTDSNHETTTETSKTTISIESGKNSTTAKDDDEDDDDDDEDESGHNSTSHTSTTKGSSVSSTAAPLSSSTTVSSTSTTSTTKINQSHKHKGSSSTSTTPEPDGISSTETVTKKHHHHHHHHRHHHHHHHHHKHNTSTTAVPSTTVAYESHKDSKPTSPMNKTDIDGKDDHNNGNKTEHKSGLEVIESFFTGLVHKTDKTKDNSTSTEAPVTPHDKTHKKKHRKSKHKKTSTVPTASSSTDLIETNYNSSSTVKPENSTINDTEMSTTIKPKGDTKTFNSTSKTDSSSFPIISVNRSKSDEKSSTTISPDIHTNLSSSTDLSKSNSTTKIPTLGPYVEEHDDIIPTESIVYSDWNPDIFP